MSFTVHKDVMVAMRDGVELATDLWVPDATPAPTLLVRLPYSKDLPGLLGYGLWLYVTSSLPAYEAPPDWHVAQGGEALGLFLMISAFSFNSFAIMPSKSATDIGSGSQPSFLMCSTTSGDSTSAVMSSCSLSTIARGVFAATSAPTQKL